MKRILRAYSVLTTICLCVTMLFVGVVIAENNTRKLSFGEEKETVQIYNTSDEKVGVSSGNSSFEVPQKYLQKIKDILIEIKCSTSPVINNLDWLKDNIKEIVNNN